MALEFYWKGSDNIDDFDPVEYSKYTYWNEPTNWFVKSTVSSSEFTSATGDVEFYTRATRAPHGGDIVYFKKLQGDVGLGLNGGPWPKTPCLFGGMALTGGSLEWIGSSGTSEEKESYCAKIIIDTSYGCSWYDPLKDETLPPYRFGKDSTGYSADGINWTGLHLGANVFENDQNGQEPVNLNTFYGGNFIQKGKAVLNIVSGTADNFIYNHDMTYVIDGVDECNNYTVLNSFVTCEVLNTLRIESRAMYKGYLSHTCRTSKPNHVRVAPGRSGLDYWVYRGNAELVTIEPWRTDFRGVEEKSKFRIGAVPDENGAIQYGDVEIDSLNMKVKNDIYGWVWMPPYPAGLSLNSEVWFEAGCTLSYLNANGGIFRLNNLTEDQSFSILDGLVSDDTFMHLYSNNVDTKIRIGSEDSALPETGLQVSTTVDSYSGRLKAPKFYFAPGAFINSKTGIDEDNWENLAGFPGATLSSSTSTIPSLPKK